MRPLNPSRARNIIRAHEHATPETNDFTRPNTVLETRWMIDISLWRLPIVSQAQGESAIAHFRPALYLSIHYQLETNPQSVELSSSKKEKKLLPTLIKALLSSLSTPSLLSFLLDPLLQSLNVKKLPKRLCSRLSEQARSFSRHCASIFQTWSLHIKSRRSRYMHSSSLPLRLRH